MCASIASIADAGGAARGEWLRRGEVDVTRRVSKELPAAAASERVSQLLLKRAPPGIQRTRSRSESPPALPHRPGAGRRGEVDVTPRRRVSQELPAAAASERLSQLVLKRAPPGIQRTRSRSESPPAAALPHRPGAGRRGEAAGAGRARGLARALPPVPFRRTASRSASPGRQQAWGATRAGAVPAAVRDLGRSRSQLGAQAGAARPSPGLHGDRRPESASLGAQKWRSKVLDAKRVGAQPQSRSMKNVRELLREGMYVAPGAQDLEWGVARNRPASQSQASSPLSPAQPLLAKSRSDPVSGESACWSVPIFEEELTGRLARKMQAAQVLRVRAQEDAPRPRRRVAASAASLGSQLLDKLSAASFGAPKEAQPRRCLMAQGAGKDKDVRVKNALLRKVERLSRQLFREMFAGLPEDELDVEIHRVFHSFDADGNSTLDKDEFAQAFNVMGLGLSREQCDAAFDQYDLDANGSIDAHEFCQMVSKRAKEDMCQHVVCWRSSSARAYICMFCGSWSHLHPLCLGPALHDARGDVQSAER